MSRTTEVRSGAFVLIALMIFAISSLWIAGYDPLSSRRVPYEILMTSAGGIRAGDGLRLAGVNVGRIEGVTLSPGSEWPVRFRVAIDTEVSIVAGTQARFASDGLLGSIYLDLVSGPETADELPAGARLYGTDSATINDLIVDMSHTAKKLDGLIDESTQLLTEVSAELVPTLQRAQALMSDQNAAVFTDTLAALRETLETSGPLLPPLLRRLDEVAIELEAGIANVPAATEELRQTMSALRNVLGEDGQRLIDVLDAAGRALEAASGAFSVVEGQAEDLEIALANLREASAHLKAFSAAVRSKPSLLLRDSRQPDRRPGDGMDR